MARVLITGIAGFIGSSLARALLAQGATVRGIDDLSSGRYENLEEIKHRIDFRVAGILDAESIADACKGVDYVFHEAAIPSVPLSIEDPLGTHGPNLTGTLALLETARNAGVRRLIYASSSAVYGEAPALPKTETMLPGPITPYGVQKLAGEHYLAAYARVFGLDTVSLRYFNVFGPRQDPKSQYSGVLAIFIERMLHGETPTIFGDGTTSRDFVYIDNVVSANLLAARSSGLLAGSVFNVGTGRRTTLLEAYEEIKRITGYAGTVDFRPERDGDIRHSLADITKAQKALGYSIVADLRTGLQKTIEWCRTQSPNLDTDETEVDLGSVAPVGQVFLDLN
jgi:UDP-glucose 4-epimerase